VKDFSGSIPTVRSDIDFGIWPIADFRVVDFTRCSAGQAY
jgi:hypothetical protein